MLLSLLLACATPMAPPSDAPPGAQPAPLEAPPPPAEEEHRALQSSGPPPTPTAGAAPASAPVLAAPPASWQAAAAHADALQPYQDWDGMLAVLEPQAEHVDDADLASACLFRYLHGRALYKKARRKEVDKVFGSAGTDCAAFETGPKIAYLDGKTHLLRGQYRSAARDWSKMAELYPEHNYADDGLVLAGEALWRAKDPAGARRLWRQAVDTMPAGDMIPQALWRLAWTDYLAGRGDAAKAHAAELGGLEPSRDWQYVALGMYWAGRWSLYPDVDAPRVAQEAGRPAAIRWWRKTIEAQPWSYAAALARGRLLSEGETPPAVARPETGDTWTLRRGLLDSPLSAQLQAGEFDAARDTLAGLEPTPDEMGWWAESMANLGQPVQAHRELRAWVTTHNPAVVDADSVRLLRTAHPDLWLDEVRSASEGYRFAPAYFHGLVRVESNFDPSAVSWAGARGLCQVMPATGRSVGRWLGLDITEEDLLVPETNLRVGARFMDELHRRFENNPALAAAGYNAGENRVDTWLERHGNLPTDEFVERIPYDETRDYARRVVGAWQSYTWLRSGESIDLSPYMHRAVPSR